MNKTPDSTEKISSTIQILLHVQHITKITGSEIVMQKLIKNLYIV